MHQNVPHVHTYACFFAARTLNENLSTKNGLVNLGGHHAQVSQYYPRQEQALNFKYISLKPSRTCRASSMMPLLINLYFIQKSMKKVMYSISCLDVYNYRRYNLGLIYIRLKNITAFKLSGQSKNLIGFMAYLLPPARLISTFEELGPFLTAMTFHSIRVEFYMTIISFLTAFFSVLLCAPKRLTLFHVEQISTDFVLCSCTRGKKARYVLKRNLNIVWDVFKQNLNMMC